MIPLAKIENQERNEGPEGQCVIFFFFNEKFLSDFRYNTIATR